MKYGRCGYLFAGTGWHTHTHGYSNTAQSAREKLEGTSTPVHCWSDADDDNNNNNKLEHYPSN